jgi:hypothetical protein
MVSDQFGDDLFMGWPEGQLAVTAVGKSEKGLAESSIPTGFLPQLNGLESREHQFLSPGFIHLIADNVFYFLEHPPGEGQVGINAGGDLVYHAGSKQ